MNKEKKILIIDDTNFNLLFLDTLLRDAGYKTFPVDSGELALASLENITPDLILLDIIMPDMSGFEVCKRIKQNPKLAKIPIIFLTADNDMNNKIEGFRLGAVDYITKPFNKDELLIRTETHINLRQNEINLKKINSKLKTVNKKLYNTYQKVLNSENSFKELFDNMSDGCAILEADEENKNFIFIDFNKASANLEKIKKENIVGKKITDAFPYIKETELFNVIKRVFKTGIAEFFPDAFFYDKNSKKIWRNYYIYKLSNGNIITVYTDKTKEKETELILKKQNNKLLLAKNEAEKANKRIKQVLDAFDTPVYLNSNSNKNKIIYYNKALEKIIGKNKIGTKCFKSIFNLKEKCEWCRTGELNEYNTKISYDVKIPTKEQHLNISNILLDNNKILTIILDITERIKTDQKIFNAIISAEEKERSKLANELHDGLGPLMSTLNLFIQGIDKVEDADIIKTFAKKSQTVFNEIMQTITEVSNNLSPHILHKFGLYTGIKVFIERISKNSEINFIFDFDKKLEEKSNNNMRIEDNSLSIQLDELHEITIYRIITELINNTVKHSKATNIYIKIKKQGQDILINYTDNGIGFEIEEVLRNNLGLGIQNIKNRLKKINGTVKFVSSKNKGFSADIVINCLNN